MKKSEKNSKSPITKLLKNKVVLITGGAGSIGSSLTKTLLNYPVSSIKVFDNNEHALFKLSHSLDDPRVEPLLGDILDKDRVELATLETDIIIHTAALKNIEITEYNPIEAIDVFSFVHKNTKFSELLRKYLREKENYSPMLTGNDLIAIGVPKGHLVGKLLDAISELRIEGDIVTKEDEIAFVYEKIKS